MSGPQVDYVEYVEGRLAWLRRLAYLLCQDWHEAGARIAMIVSPITVAPMTAIGGQVRYGIQVPARCLETNTAGAAPAPRWVSGLVAIFITCHFITS